MLKLILPNYCNNANCWFKVKRNLFAKFKSSTVYRFTFVPTYLPTYRFTFVPTYLSLYFCTYLHIALLLYLRTYLWFYFCTYLPTYFWHNNAPYSVKTTFGISTLQNGPANLCLFLFIFVLFSIIFTDILYSDISRIRTRIVWVGGEHVDHLTTTTTHGPLAFQSCKSCLS